MAGSCLGWPRSLTRVSTYWAFLDESEPALEPPGVFVAAAAILEAADREQVRTEVAGLRGQHQKKLHWYDEPAFRRDKLVGAVAGYTALHQVVVRHCGADEKPERRRRKCLERLLLDLQEAGVGELVAEARQEAQNKREQHWFNGLRSQRLITAPMKLSHVKGPLEPLLALPDLAAGAVGEDLKGDSHYRRALDAVLTVRTID